MKKLIKYLNPYKKECIFAPLFKMLEAIFELFVPLVVATVIDKGIVNGNRLVIYKSVVLLFVLALIGLISAILAQFYAARAATGFATDVRYDMFLHIMNYSYRDIDIAGTSKLITRMTSDINQAQSGVNMFLRLFLRSPFIVFGAIIMAFSIDRSLSLHFIIVVAVLFAVVFLVMKVNITMLKSVQQKLDQIVVLVRENITGVRVIRAFGLEENEIKVFKENNEELSMKQKQAGRLSSVLNPVTYVCINIAIIILMQAGAIKVNSGLLTQGQVVALYNYMSQILVELIKLANLISLVNRAVASMDRIQEVFDTGGECHDDFINDTKNCAFNEGIEFKNVSFKYSKDGEYAVENISFYLKKGERIGIIGGTGSGKTTVINLMAGFYEAGEGEILLDGRNINTYGNRFLRKIFGIVPQKSVLFEGTIRDNLKLGNDEATDDELKAAVKQAVCEEVVNSKGGLDAYVDEAGDNFSGGQKQRLSIARTLVMKPSVLILDDSSSALDSLTDYELRRNIEELDYKPTVIIISQRTSRMNNLDRILCLEDGKLVGVGTHEELINNCQVYREIYSSQN